jgi:hypothetical protein
MIPQAFVRLPALPRTPHGKINRRALPAPDAARPELAAVYVAPQTEVEQTLAGIWQDVLKLERVGVHDNFFELGGHSLLLVRVHSRVRDLFGSQVTLLDLFRYPTISTLGRYLRVGNSQTSAVQQDFTHGEKRREALMRQKENRRKHRAAAKKTFTNPEDDR